MPLRFNKRVSLGKFLRLNISKSGVGLTVGPRGANVTVGPRGTHATVGLPGTGLSYTQKIADAKVGRFDSISAPPSTPHAPQHFRDPGPFAPDYEKELVAGLNDFYNGQADSALAHLLAAAPHEPAAAIFAAFVLAGRSEGRARAIELLEGVAQSDAKLPTVLMQKYLASATLPVAISPTVSADVPADGLAASLLLAELYQAEGQVDEAIALLDEINDLAQSPALTLSLCELLANKNMWDEIIALAKDTAATDDVTLETKVWYGRAMLEKGLPEAAASVFGEALKKKKGISPPLLNEARYWRAAAYERLGKTAQASKEFQKLYADDPEFRDVARRVGDADER
ncbi:MAG: DUF4236 domain-containing protein [Chloroflexi bacterium]|nr:DUF4236 domain-containing protein [Chloroflexota bacterium]